MTKREILIALLTAIAAALITPLGQVYFQYLFEDNEQLSVNMIHVPFTVPDPKQFTLDDKKLSELEAHMLSIDEASLKFIEQFVKKEEAEDPHLADLDKHIKEMREISFSARSDYLIRSRETREIIRGIKYHLSNKSREFQRPASLVILTILNDSNKPVENVFAQVPGSLYYMIGDEHFDEVQGERIAIGTLSQGQRIDVKTWVLYGISPFDPWKMGQDVVVGHANGRSYVSQTALVGGFAGWVDQNLSWISAVWPMTIYIIFIGGIYMGRVTKGA